MLDTSALKLDEGWVRPQNGNILHGAACCQFTRQGRMGIQSNANPDRLAARIFTG